MINYYKVFEIDPNNTGEEIKKTLKKHLADAKAQKDDNKRALVKKAYQTLCTDDNRIIYDEKLNKKNIFQSVADNKIFKQTDKKVWYGIGIFIIVIIIGLTAGYTTNYYINRYNNRDLLTEDDAKDRAERFINENYNISSKAKVTKIKDSNSYLYELEVEIGSSDAITMYISKDGDMFYPQGDKIKFAEMSKKDTAEAALYIWSYCPYGVVALDAFADVGKAMADDAKLSVIFNYAGHGAHELQENKIQACIQKYEPKKYWDYAADYTEKVYTTCKSKSGDDAVSCDKEQATNLMRAVSIDPDKIFNCVNDEGANLYQANLDEASDAGAGSSSPTFLINSVQLKSPTWSANDLKNDICNGYKNEPAICDETLSTNAKSASGSCD